jgi:hypothetical protein
MIPIVNIGSVDLTILTVDIFINPVAILPKWFPKNCPKVRTNNIKIYFGVSSCLISKGGFGAVNTIVAAKASCADVTKLVSKYSKEFLLYIL